MPAGNLPNPHAKKIGFIDIGTNSIRLLLVEYFGGFSYRVITQQKETVRLGENEFIQETLQPEAMQRAIMVGRQFKELAVSYGAVELIAVATAAVRDAVNRDDFLHRLSSEADLDARIVSGREEARLIYLGVASGTNLNEQKACFIDIGGGSTELIIGSKQQYDYLDSLKLGAIRLTTLQPMNTAKPISASSYAKLQQQVRHTAVRSLEQIRNFKLDIAVGSSGTAENLAEIACRHLRGRHLLKEDIISYKELKETIRMLCSMPLEERRHVSGINPERADIIIAGAAILDTLMAELGLQCIQISDRTLRDGLLVDYMNRHNPAGPSEIPSIRKESILQLGRACHFNEIHARRVADLALQLYDSLPGAGIDFFNSWERELLEYAALLHDIGSFLSYTNHQAHSYYLIRNADLLGFNQTEIAVIAATAFYHRRTIPRKRHPEFGRLERPCQRTVLALSVLLRLAESLDRSHNARINRVSFHLRDKTSVTMKLETSADCQLELWGLRNHEKPFAEAFGRRFVPALIILPSANTPHK